MQTHKTISIKNHLGLKIKLDLHLPKKTIFSFKKEHPLVIFCHGFMGTKDHPFLIELSDTLSKNGFAVARFDFTNEIGKSEGTLSKISIKNEIEDIKTIIKYMSKQETIDKNKIALIGHSLGGIISLLAKQQIKTKNIKTTISLSSPYKIEKDILLEFGATKKNLQQWNEKTPLEIKNKYFKKTHKLPYSFFEEIKEINIEQLSKNTKNHLLIHGTKDKIVPLDDANTLYNNLQKPKKKIIAGNLAHFYKHENAIKLIQKEITIWLKQYLK